MPDYMFLLESRLAPAQRQALERVAEAAQNAELNVYLAGGAVRDLIIGMPIRDLDFVVQGNPARIVAALEKQGAEVVERNEKLRHVEMVFAGGAEGSIAAARDEIYAYPGTRPELRWATIIEDLRRRDFSMNAIAISLSAASRGLLLDPTNGLADLEKREIRVLSMHSFTNQPVRLLRLVRFAARTGLEVEARTREWFALAMERRLLASVDPAQVGAELRALAREDNPVAILKAWAKEELLGVIHARLPRRLPDYTRLNKLMKVCAAMESAGVRARRAEMCAAPVLLYTLGRLKSRERALALGRMEFTAAEVRRITGLEKEAARAGKLLRGRKTASPRDAFYFIDRLPPDLLAWMQVEVRNAKVIGKIRNYLGKWKPLRDSLFTHTGAPRTEGPADELAALGVPRGPKFDKILTDLFHLQLAGRARSPQDRLKALRQLAGIKPEPKPKPKPAPARAEPPKKKARSTPVHADAGRVRSEGAREAGPKGAPKPAETPAPGRAAGVKGGSAGEHAGAPVVPAKEGKEKPARPRKEQAKGPARKATLRTRRATRPQRAPKSGKGRRRPFSSRAAKKSKRKK